MSLQLFNNRLGQLIIGGPNAGYGMEVPLSYANRIIDAVGESTFMIGRLVWSDGGTHTVSSAGGKIYFYTGVTTFANASTNLRVGIQDLSSGLEDGTFDVFADHTPALGETLASNAIKTFTMESGSKSIAHGASVAIGCEMTARGGVDSVIIRSISNTGSNHPYNSSDTGAGPTRFAVMVPVVVDADDGTVGWILGCPVPFNEDTITLSDVTVPDEIALVFRLPFPARVHSPVCYAQPQSGDTFDFKLYSDPYGTPTLLASDSVDPSFMSQSATINTVYGSFSTQDLAANTDYALSVRATGSGFALQRLTFSSAAHRAASLLGTNWTYSQRTDSTGAFGDFTTFLPRIGLHIQALDDGAGSGTVILIEDD